MAMGGDAFQCRHTHTTQAQCRLHPMTRMLVGWNPVGFVCAALIGGHQQVGDMDTWNPNAILSIMPLMTFHDG